MGTSSRRLTRRSFLLVGCSAGAATLLAACAGASTPTAAPAAKPAAEPTKPAAAPAAKPAEAAKAETKPTAAPAAKPAATTKGIREVSFMSTGNEGEQTMFKEVIAAAQKASLDALGIKINWNPFPGGGFDQITTLFVSGKAYDIQRTNDDHIYTLAVENKIHQLDAWMLDQKMKKDDYSRTFWASLAVEGYQYSMTPAAGAMTIYYNKDLFDKAGIKAPTAWKDAWSWEEFLTNARKLAKVSGNKTDVYAIGAISNAFPAVGYGAGGQAYNEDQTKCAWDSKEVHDAIDAFVQLALKEKIFAPFDLNRQELFNAGKLAMNWDLLGFDRGISKSIKWDIMPSMKTPKWAMAATAARTFTIPKTAKDPEAAFLGLKAICEKDASDVFAKHRFGIPHLKASAEGPALGDANTPPEHKKIWGESFGEIDGHPIDVPLPRGPVGDAFKSAVKGDLLSAALSGQMTTKQYQDQAVARVNEAIAKYQWKKGRGLELLEKGGGLNATKKFFS